MKEASLGTRAVRGAIFAALSKYTVTFITFAGGIILRRLLSPEPFGTVAFAAFIVALFGRAVEWGFNQALIHRRERVESAVSNALALYLILGGGVFVLIVLLSPVLGSALRETLSGRWTAETTSVVIALSAILFIELGGAVPVSLLERELSFRRLFIVEAGSAFLSVCAGVGCALAGWGVWSIVVWRGTNAGLRSLGAWSATSTKPTPSLSAEEVRWFFRFGYPLWVSAMLFFVVTKLDDFLVGAVRSMHELGLYSTAFDYSLVPLALVSGVLSRVSFPVYSSLQGEAGRLSEAFRLNSRAILFGTVFLMGTGALVAPEFFGYILGERWSEAVILFRILVPYGILRPLIDDCGSLLTALGHPRKVRNIMLVEALATTVLCPAGVYLWGAEGAGISAGLVILIGLIFAYSRYLPRFIEVRYQEVLLLPLLSGALSVAVAYSVFRLSGIPEGAVSFALKVLLMFIIYPSVALLLGGTKLREELRTFFRLASL